MADGNNNQADDISIRKLQRTGRAGASTLVTLPKKMIDELGWEGQEKVVIEKQCDELIIKKWEDC